MARVEDVAAWFLTRSGAMTAMKLQKLVYYAQAWTLVRLDRPLFPEVIRAYVNGPVCPVLFMAHRGQFKVTSLPGNTGVFTADELDVLERVLGAYGSKTASWLRDLTHREAPWTEARRGVKPGDPSREVISHSSMREHYSKADTAEAQLVMGTSNPLIDFMEAMDEREAALIDELAERDARAEDVA